MATPDKLVCDKGENEVEPIVVKELIVKLPENDQQINHSVDEKCSPVPLQIEGAMPNSEMVAENKTLGCLTIVPTIDDDISEPNVKDLPDLIVKGPVSEDKSSEISNKSEEKSSVDPNKEVTPLGCGNNDKMTPVEISESVLPSMGILPGEEKATDSHISSNKKDLNASSDVENQENSKQFEHKIKKIKWQEIEVEPSKIVHKIKKIKWQDIEVPIITQNNNGPCPLIAIVNVMLLKGQITLPSDRTEISGGELVLMVGNALFDQPRNALPSDMRQHIEQNTEDAISILHKLLTGLDVNIKFSGVRDFEFTGELCVFDLLGIMLYHGWVVDPTSEVAQVIGSLSYNQLTNNIVSWREEAIKDNNNDLLVKAMLCEEFMASSGSQLTIHGLFELGSTLEKEEIAVLFRNNHFSTIYKRGDQLYQLLTDQGFLHENMVWETLNDVDANFSEFVNGKFQSIAPSVSTSTPEETGQNAVLQQQINSDKQLAEILQRESDLQQQQVQSFERLKDSLGLHNMSDEEMAQKLQEEENRLAADAASTTPAEGSGPRQTAVGSPLPFQASNTTNNPHDEKKKKDCTIL